MAHIDKFGLFKRNAYGVFAGGYNTMNLGRKYEEIDIALSYLKWFGHTMSFFATVPTGAAVKTIFDIATRHVIPDEQMDEIRKKILLLNDDELEMLVTNISLYHPKSHSSVNLLNQLKDVRQKEISEIQNTRKNLEKQIKDLQTESSIKFGGFTNKDKMLILGTKKNIFSPEELKLIDEKVKEATIHFGNQRKQEQRNAIINYLDDNKNVGKKMEHVIQDNVRKLAT